MNEQSDPSVGNLEDVVDWFERIMMYDCGSEGLDGINSTFLQSFDDVLVKESSDAERRKALIPIAIEVETFLEKVIYLTEGIDFSSNDSISLVDHIERLKLSQKLNNRQGKASDFLTENSIHEFRGEADFLAHIARTYVRRNEITHNSPVYDQPETFLTIQSILIVSLFAVFKNLEGIKNKINANLDSLQKSDSSGNLKAEALYDFINHGETALEIKTQLVRSYIIHSLFKENSQKQIAELNTDCNSYFKADFSSNFIHRQIEKLHAKDKIDISPDKLSVKLESSEVDRISKLVEDFEIKETLLRNSINNYLKPYYLEGALEEVYSQVELLVEKNYSYDAEEMLDKVYDESKSNILAQDFLTFIKSKLKSRGKDESNAEQLFIDIVKCCSSNDILHRKAASKVYAEKVQSNNIQNYVRRKGRKIYLDTQVLLYIICAYYERIKNTSIIEYDTAVDLLSLVKKDAGLSLHTTEEYLSELAFQIKNALLLIPFEEVEFFSGDYSTSNVFYNFYAFLKTEDKLEDHIESFRDFLSELDFEYEDLGRNRHLKYLADICYEHLEEMDVQVIQNKNYDTGDLFKYTKKELRFERADILVGSDSNMVHFLSDRFVHSNDPYFVTWDTMFYKTRKYFLGKNKKSQFWHLYSPPRIVGHLNLVNFTIDAKSFTREFISIISSSKFRQDTANLVDQISEFLGVESNSNRRLLKGLRSLSLKYLDGKDAFENLPRKNNIVSPIGELLQHLTYHYNGNYTEFDLERVKSLFIDEYFSDQVLVIFDKGLAYFKRRGQFSKELIRSLDKLIRSKEE